VGFSRLITPENNRVSKEQRNPPVIDPSNAPSRPPVGYHLSSGRIFQVNLVHIAPTPILTTLG
jgi:hypothetical protein